MGTRGDAIRASFARRVASEQPAPLPIAPARVPAPAVPPAQLADMLAALAATKAANVAPVPEPGTWEHDLARALLDVTGALGSGEAAQVREPMFVAAGDLFARTYAPSPWLVHGLITRGGIATIGAEPKSGKTWLATEIAVAVATGTLVCGEFAAAPGRVAYFYAEDLDVQVRNRLRALLAPRKLPPDALATLHVCPRGRFLDITRDEDVAWIVASCRKLGGIDLLVLDPLRDIHSGEEDKSDSMGPVMRRLRVLGELLGCTVMIAHHAGKASKETGKRRPGQKLRGSGAIHGSTDSGIYVGLSGGDGAARFELELDVEIKGARSAGHLELVLDVQDDAQGAAVSARWTNAGTAANANPAHSTEAVEDVAILQAIRDEHAAGRVYTRRAWRGAELRALTHLTQESTTAALARLEKSAAGIKLSTTRLDGFAVAHPLVYPR